MDSFIFKDISSEDFGIIVNSLPPISKPTMRVEETIIDGVDGAIYEDLGYSPYDKSIKMTLKENNIDEVINWLKGEGKLILSNEPDKYYNAKIIEQINFERLIKFNPVEVKFKVKPFKYALNEEWITLAESGKVVNEGLEQSLPTIKISGTGTIEFMVNDLIVFTYTFPENETEVIIDSERQDAYLGETLKNRNMNGDFPIFQVGENNISWNGEVTNIEVLVKSRWL